jgi:ribosome modulation factor
MTLLRTMTPYEQGLDAFNDDVPLNRCPFPIGSKTRKQWTNGWLDGRGKKVKN